MHHDPERILRVVHRAMRSLGLSGTPWDKGIRTTVPAFDGIRAGDLLNRDFAAPDPIKRGSPTSRIAASGRLGVRHVLQSRPRPGTGRQQLGGMREHLYVCRDDLSTLACILPINIQDGTVAAQRRRRNSSGS